MNHTHLLRYLIEKYQLDSYCEIGLQNAKNNFDKIYCKKKVSVDPDLNANAIFQMTSDEYFSFNKEKFSIFFIDGLHTANQVKKDFENSLRCLNDGGFIVLHDTLPDNEEGTLVPRQTKMWWGDTYQFAMTLRTYYGINFVTLNTDNGCTIVWKQSNRRRSDMVLKVDWETYSKFKKEYLNIIDPSELEATFNNIERVAVVS